MMKQPKLPPLKTLPAFIAVAKYLNFSKAANSLHLTHSAISQSIKVLEEFLGHQLFVRNAGGVKLTKAGSEYYSSINTALNVILDATQKQLATPDNNILTINVMTTLTLRWLIPRLSNFQAEYPAIDLRISTLGRAVDFNTDNIDLAIVYGHSDDWSGLNELKLFDDRLVLVANNKLLTGSLPLNKLVEQHKAIYVDAELRLHDWQLWCKKAKVKEPKKSNRIYFQNSSQALLAAASGVGIMVTHKPFIIDDLQSGQLIQLSKLGLSLTKSYYLVYPKDTSNDNKKTSFINWLIKMAKV